jgi:hypothetical protein
MTVIRTQEQTFTDGTGIETPAESSFHLPFSDHDGLESRNTSA